MTKQFHPPEFYCYMHADNKNECVLLKTYIFYYKGAASYILFTK